MCPWGLWKVFAAAIVAWLMSNYLDHIDVCCYPRENQLLLIMQKTKYVHFDVRIRYTLKNIETGYFKYWGK